MNKNTNKTKPPQKKENLKQRAYLNSVTSALDYGAKTITVFIVTPIIVNGLGSMLYGVWQVLGQFTSYTNVADIKATEVLKWAIAKDRDEKSEKELREYLTATFLLILLIIPVLLIAGSIIVWYSPVITGVDPDYTDIVRITCAILVLTLVTNKAFSIFESILRGMNIGFKRMGFRATITIIGGGLQVTVIYLGYGLIGLAFVQLLVAFILGLTIYVIVKRNVPWFGFGKLDFKRSLSFLKISGWFVGWTGTKLLLLSSDKILLGYIAGPVLVTQYVITRYFANIVHGTITNVVHGVIPGMGKLFGNNQLEKLYKVREHIMLITWFISSIIGAIAILFNESFLLLWVGDEIYAGNIANLLIIVMIVQYIFIQNDSAIINTTLDIKQKVYLGLVSAVISLGIILFLVKDYGIIGLCVGLITGRMVMSVGYPWIFHKKINKKIHLKEVPVRQIVTMIVLWSLAYYAKNIVEVTNWITLIMCGVSVSLILTPLLYFFGISRKQRSELNEYKDKIKLFSSN